MIFCYRWCRSRRWQTYFGWWRRWPYWSPRPGFDWSGGCTRTTWPRWTTWNPHRTLYTSNCCPGLTTRARGESSGSHRMWVYSYVQWNLSKPILIISPTNKVWGYIGITLSVRLSVQSKLNLDHNFLTKGDRALILQKCIPCDKTFLFIPEFLLCDLDLDFWPTFEKT